MKPKSNDVIEIFNFMKKQSLSNLIKLLNDPDEDLSYFAAEAIGELGDKAAPAIPNLLKLLSHFDHRNDDDSLNKQAAWALGKIGKLAMPALIEAVESDDIHAAQYAAIGLGEMGPEAEPAIPALAQALKFGNPLLCETAAEALGRIGEKAACVLIEALEDENEDVRENAEDSLSRFLPDFEKD
jgi:HEAT repeat protein